LNTEQPFAFIIPFYGDSKNSVSFLAWTIEGILAQTDQNWIAIVVDDCSTSSDAKEFLESLRSQDQDGRIVVIGNRSNKGPGFCRNVGVACAVEKGSPVVLFNDSDDISHPRRLEQTREIFHQQPDTGLVYSHVIVIDENNVHRADRKYSGSMEEILAASTVNPPEGRDCWIKIGTMTGYVNLTSTTSVRTEFILKHPFPHEYVSEDSNTWYRLSGDGVFFTYAPQIPTRYRITSDSMESHSRRRFADQFYDDKARVDIDGFQQAIRLSLARGSITPEAAVDIFRMFLTRLSKTIESEAKYELSSSLLGLVPKLSTLVDTLSEVVYAR
jgi:glycosyltransferase involved in cell wall biosynthesis